MQTQQSIQRILLLPSKIIPASFLSFIYDVNDFSVRFINGYRNLVQLTQSKQPVSALTSSQEHCGQAFCFLMKDKIDENELLKCEMKGQKIEKINDQMYVLQSAKKEPKTEELIISLEQLKKLVDDVTESEHTRKLAINLIKNAFDSFEAYQKSIGELLTKIQQQQTANNPQKLPTVAQTIVNEHNAKKLSGEMIKKVPKCNQQTGNWDYEDTIEIKISE